MPAIGPLGQRRNKQLHHHDTVDKAVCSGQQFVGLKPCSRQCLLPFKKNIAWLMTPPMAPPALTRPHTTPMLRRETNGTTAYVVPQVACNVRASVAVCFGGKVQHCQRPGSWPSDGTSTEHYLQAQSQRPVYAAPQHCARHMFLAKHAFASRRANATLVMSCAPQGTTLRVPSCPA